MAITSEPAGSIVAPIAKTAESAGSVAIPIAKTAESAGTVAIPIAKTAESAGTVAIPIAKTAESAGTVAIPIAKTAESAGTIATPIAKTAVTAAAFPRTFIPRLDLNFKHGLYAQSGVSKAQSDLVTYSRNSSASYLDRFIDSNGDWNYFVNTDFVGSVTNKLTYSEQFDHADWTKVAAATITANNALDPLNTLTADKIVATSTATSLVSLSQPITSIASTSYTVSIYAKRGEAGFIQIRFNNSEVANDPRVNFDLSTGVIGSQDADIDAASITPVGNDWFRISATVVAVGTTLTTNISVITSAGSTRAGTITLTIGEGLYIWGAQVTTLAYLSPYKKSVSAETLGTFTETIRIEYDAATGESLGALIESASTNLCLRSEEFDNASWSKTNSAVTANDTKAPDNSTSADKFEAGSTSTIGPLVYQSVTTSGSAAYTFSAYAKKSEASFIQMLFGGSEVANNPRVNFDLSTGVVGTQDADIDAASITAIGNDWYRISATVTTVGVSLQCLFALIQATDDTRNETNSWTSGDGLFIWGAQIEAQEAPTSYIRTAGSTVSRLADLVSAPTAGNVPTGDVTFYADVDVLRNNTGQQQIYTVDAGTVDIQGGISSAGSLFVDSEVVAINSAFNDSFALSAVYNNSLNTITGFLDGVQTVTADSGGPIISTISGVIGVGNSSPVSTQQLNGHIKRLTIYDKALTAQEVGLL